MKKSLFTLAAALALVGCSKEELVNVDDGQLQNGDAIAFSTYVGDNAQTRASVIEIKDIQQNGFGVNAYYTGEEAFSAETAYSGNAIFMDNTKVTYNPEKNDWTYSPVKYWPNNTFVNTDGDIQYEMVSFFAYAPYGSNQISFLNESNKSKLSFAVDFDVKNQVDLIYHKADGDETLGCDKTIDLTKQSVNSRVSFNFQHALSRITFDVKAVVDEALEGDNLLDGNTRINIKKVMLVSATKSESEDESQVEAEEGPFYTTASLDLQTGVWSEQNGAQPFILDDDHFYRGVNVDGADVVQLTKFNPGQTLLNEDSYLMIIPQDFNAETGETPEGYRIYIEYDVISEEVDNNGNSENETSDSNTITNKIYSPVMNTNFEAGKAYKFTLLLGMTSVKFEADVDDWDNATGYDDEEWLPENIPFTVDEQGNFLIQTAEELATFRDLINHGGVYVDENGQEQKYCYGNFKQMANIDLAEQFYVNSHGGRCFEPIGMDGGDGINPHTFRGTYDGQGYTVSNVNHDKDYMSGLFYKLGYNAIIKNVRVEGTTTDSWAHATGGVVGEASGATIINCHFTGTISISDKYNGHFPTYVGGVVGSSYGTITACSNGGTVSATGSSFAGGIVGKGSTVKACYNYGNVTASNVIGGIAGSAGTIVGCYNAGSVQLAEGATSNTIGNIIGKAENGTVSYCYYDNDNTYSDIGENINTTVTSVAKTSDWNKVKGFLNYGLKQASVAYHYVDSGIDTYPLALAEGAAGDDEITAPEIKLEYTLEDTGLTYQYVNGTDKINIANASNLTTARTLINDGTQLSFGTEEDKVYKLVYKEDNLDPDITYVKSSEHDYFKDANYIQTGNIDLTEEWVPIGTTENVFNGTYDGSSQSSYSISGMKITETEKDEYVGLFGYVSSKSKICNITMTDVQIGSEDKAVQGNAAAIVGKADSGNAIIENCTVSGNIYATSAAGIAYYISNGIVKNCTNNASVKGVNTTAGIVYNTNNGDVIDCTNHGAVTSENSYACGITYESRYSIVGCTNKGSVTGDYAAGICFSSNIEKCSNTGAITAKSNTAAGLIIGNTAIKVYASWNEGTITSESGSAAGIIGTATNDVKIIGCYNVGTVTGSKTKASILASLSLTNYVEDTDAQNITACYATNNDIPMIGTIIAAPGEKTYNMTFTGCYHVSDNAIESNNGNVSIDGTTKVENSTDLNSWTSNEETSPITGLNNALKNNGSSFTYIAGDTYNHPLKIQY